MEKEVYIFAIKHQNEKLLRAAKALSLIASLLSDYDGSDINHQPRVHPQSFKDKVGDAKRLELVAKVDALLARQMYINIHNRVQINDDDHADS